LYPVHYNLASAEIQCSVMFSVRYCNCFDPYWIGPSGRGHIQMLDEVELFCYQLYKMVPSLRSRLAVRGNKMLQTSDWKPLLSKPQLPVKDVYSTSRLPTMEKPLRWRPLFSCSYFKTLTTFGDICRSPRRCAACDFVPVVSVASGRPGARCQSGSQTGQTLLLPWQCHSSENKTDTEGQMMRSDLC